MKLRSINFIFILVMLAPLELLARPPMMAAAAMGGARRAAARNNRHPSYNHYDNDYDSCTCGRPRSNRSLRAERNHRSRHERSESCDNNSRSVYETDRD